MAIRKNSLERIKENMKIQRSKSLLSLPSTNIFRGPFQNMILVACRVPEGEKSYKGLGQIWWWIFPPHRPVLSELPVSSPSVLNTTLLL